MVAGLVRQALEAERRASAERQAVLGCGPSTSTVGGAATARDTSSGIQEGFISNFLLGLAEMTGQKTSVAVGPSQEKMKYN